MVECPKEKKHPTEISFLSSRINLRERYRSQRYDPHPPHDVDPNCRNHLSKKLTEIHPIEDLPKHEALLFFQPILSYPSFNPFR